MTTNLSVLLSGITAGIILFQTAVIAPTVFRGLGPDHAGPFLRKVFPTFFVFIAVLGLLTLGSAVTNDLILQSWIGGVTALFAICAYMIIPRTNKARDEGHEKSFKRLHNASVIMTVAMLLINLSSGFI
ncbi:MAG: DUF4149 domain-containing protein [Porticoccaceae bacterium]|nr:DUF4149 domain-containing protein [Porticoccaceae bacterium]MDG1475225.1 DUF4149 domain-containing protein [Porticoccaceae bacterium]